MTGIGTVYLVDDDTAVRDALGWLLRTRRLLGTPYPSGDAFWAEASGWADGPRDPSCLVLDLRMPGLSGLALFERLLTRPWFTALPVIFLSGHADVPTAVDAVLRGAFDFCEKPFSDNALVSRIEAALKQSAAVLAERERERERLRRLSELTDRERKVMELMIDGLPNKRVAEQLQISVRTVEVHRARIFDKMNVRSVVELVRLVHPS